MKHIFLNDNSSKIKYDYICLYLNDIKPTERNVARFISTSKLRKILSKEDINYISLYIEKANGFRKPIILKKPNLYEKYIIYAIKHLYKQILFI